MKVPWTGHSDAAAAAHEQPQPQSTPPPQSQSQSLSYTHAAHTSAAPFAASSHRALWDAVVHAQLTQALALSLESLRVDASRFKPFQAFLECVLNPTWSDDQQQRALAEHMADDIVPLFLACMHFTKLFGGRDVANRCLSPPTPLPPSPPLPLPLASAGSAVAPLVHPDDPAAGRHSGSGSGGSGLVRSIDSTGATLESLYVQQYLVGQALSVARLACAPLPPPRAPTQPPALTPPAPTRARAGSGTRHHPTAAADDSHGPAHVAAPAPAPAVAAMFQTLRADPGAVRAVLDSLDSVALHLASSAVPGDTVQVRMKHSDLPQGAIRASFAIT
jgi:hypothetical protein